MKIRTAHLQPISPQIIPSIFTSYIQLTPTADMNFLISITNAVNIPINPHLSHQINPEHRHEYHNLHNQRRKYPPPQIRSTHPTIPSAHASRLK